MAADHSSASSRVSRRHFLFIAAAGSGSVLAGGLTSSPADAAKMSPKAMSYRPSPNGNQRCDNCANFEPPNGCKVVDGAISANGWCILYRPK